MNLVCLFFYLFIFFFLFFFFFFCVLCRNSKWPPKVAGKRFLVKIASRLCRFCGNCSISLHFRDKWIFVLYAGIQKWRENNFCEKMPVDSADTMRIKIFIEITLSRSISEINTFLCFTQKFKMAAKRDRKAIFGKSRQ